MDSFGEDFTNALEQIVGNSETHYEPTKDTWQPRAQAAPERHALNAANNTIDFETLLLSLQRNEWCDRIGTVLKNYISASVLKPLYAAANARTEIEKEKEQVWLFALQWFNTYYTYLLDAHVLRTNFYKTDHGRFMALMKKMLSVQPGYRPTFKEALAEWYPQSKQLSSRQSQNEDGDDDATPRRPVPHSAPSVSSSAKSVATGVACRLVLKGWGGSAARSKTRKNRGN